MKITKSKLKQIIKEELDDPYRNVPDKDLLGLLQAAKQAVGEVMRYEGVIPPAMKGHIQDADMALERAWALWTGVEPKGEY